MAEDKAGGAAAVEAADEDEIAFEAPERGSADELLDAGAHAPIDAMRHSAAHVMAEAVLALFPGAKLGIGPAIENGFYYDFELPRPLTPDDLAAIEGRMRESVVADHPFVRREVGFDEGRAIEDADGQAFKVEILDDLAQKALETATPMPPVTFYEHGPFRDLCKGPHVESTGHIGPFKLLAVAGAYWRGDEKRPMLQRIYGTVWETQEDLDRYLWRREEAKKRDHRKLGVQLDLFTFHDVSPGSAFWHPKGQRIWRTLETAMRELQERRGYEEISTPIVVSERLWRQSGHWDHYAENMFIVEAEGQKFSLKPMNCPESTFVYRSHLRSYRDLPLRLNEYGRLHRNERSGTLSGLTRVRQFIQDDAHIYLRPDQLSAEIEALLGEVREAFGWFGLEPRFAFATRPDKAIGDPALWRARRAADQGSAGPIRRRLRDQAEGRDVLRAQDRHLHRRCARARVADGDDPGGPRDAAGAVRSHLHRRGRPAETSDGDPPRDLRVVRAVHRNPRRALRGIVPAVDRAGSGRDHPDRRSPRGAGTGASGGAAGRGPAVRGGGRFRRPDAEQVPGWRRDRRSRTCSSWATARSRPGPRRCGGAVRPRTSRRRSFPGPRSGAPGSGGVRERRLG